MWNPELNLKMQPDESWHSATDPSKSCLVLEMGKTKYEEDLEEKRKKYFMLPHIKVVILVYLDKALSECWVRHLLPVRARVSFLSSPNQARVYVRRGDRVIKVQTTFFLATLTFSGVR